MARKIFWAAIAPFEEPPMDIYQLVHSIFRQAVGGSNYADQRHVYEVFGDSASLEHNVPANPWSHAKFHSYVLCRH